MSFPFHHPATVDNCPSNTPKGGLCGKIPYAAVPSRCSAVLAPLVAAEHMAGAVLRWALRARSAPLIRRPVSPLCMFAPRHNQ